ncbi:hypothetical protein VE02_04341 [Pseudogymnoascus sp. 03VT05]|nr:hypothetical protein VE02_04341 [Pseudogymnoascus sp. 03VT05]
MVVVQVLAYIKIVDSREAQRQIHLRKKAESDKRQRISNGKDREALAFAAKIQCIPSQDGAVDGRMSRDERLENVLVEGNYLSSTPNSTGETRLTLFAILDQELQLSYHEDPHNSKDKTIKALRASNWNSILMRMEAPGETIHSSSDPLLQGEAQI